MTDTDDPQASGPQPQSPSDSSSDLVTSSASGGTPDTALPPTGAGGSVSTGAGGTLPATTGGSFSAGTGGDDGVDPDPGEDEPGEDDPAPIGDGWTEYFPEWHYHVPPNAKEYGERYTYEDGVFHFWVKDTDLSTFPGNDSGPRSEVRVQNEYTSGSRQFQADVMVVAGAEKVGIWQLFQRPWPWMIRVYDGDFRQYGDGSTFDSASFGTWRRFHTIHEAATRKLQIYIDGQLVLDTTISESDGSVDFYNKFGVYGRDGMGALNEIYFKNVHYFEK